MVFMWGGDGSGGVWRRGLSVYAPGRAFLKTLMAGKEISVMELGPLAEFP